MSSEKGRHPFSWQTGYEEGCVFCKIVREDPYNQIVWRSTDQSTLAFVPRGPVVPGHHLVVSLNHVIDAVHLSNTSAHSMMAAYKFGREELKFDDFDIAVNVGADAGQTVFHLHIHVYPRHRDDNLSQPGWKPDSTFVPWLVLGSSTGCPITAVNNGPARQTSPTWQGQKSIAITPLGTLITDHWLLVPAMKYVHGSKDDPWLLIPLMYDACDLIFAKDLWPCNIVINVRRALVGSSALVNIFGKRAEGDGKCMPWDTPPVTQL